MLRNLRCTRHASACPPCGNATTHCTVDRNRMRRTNKQTIGFWNQVCADRKLRDNAKPSHAKHIYRASVRCRRAVQQHGEHVRPVSENPPKQPIICSRTRMGCSNPIIILSGRHPATPEYLSIYADAGDVDAAIVSQAEPTAPLPRLGARPGKRPSPQCSWAASTPDQSTWSGNGLRGQP